jgi:hypothetical protein
MFDIHDYTQGRVHVLDLRKEAYEQVNTLVNDCNGLLGAYVTSVSALDYLEVLEHPDIYAANERIQSMNWDDPELCEQADMHIRDVYKVVGKTLNSPTELRGNRVAEGIKSALLKIGQIQQVFGPRGILQDISYNVFNKPIVYGFAHGLVTLADSMMESRAASLALFLQKDPLADVEYFNRELQLVGNIIDHVVNYDCGSTDYVPWTVKEKHLPSLAGKNHVLADGSIKRILGNETHLVNTTIFLRSPMQCKHISPKGVCLACLGDIGLSIDEETSLGHMAVIELCSAVSQNVLSTKHLNGSALVDEFIVPTYDEPYIAVLPDRVSIAISSKIKPKRTTIAVLREEVPNLNDIALCDISDLSISRISQLSSVQFITEDDDGFGETTPVSVCMGSRLSSFSKEFLEHIARVGYETDAKYIKVSLAGWTHNQPLFVLPKKQSSMIEFMADVKSLIKGNGDNQAKEHLDLSDHNSLAIALADFYDLVSGKFVINIALLEVILKATMIRSKSRGDFRLPLPGGEAQFGRYSEIIGGRSLAAQAAYQEQHAVFSDPAAFLRRLRTPHPFDPIINPTV